MKLNDAMATCFPPETYDAMRKHLSPPELLNAAALECFLHPQPPEVENEIRASLLELRQTGIMPKQ